MSADESGVCVCGVSVDDHPVVEDHGFVDSGVYYSDLHLDSLDYH